MSVTVLTEARLERAVSDWAVSNGIVHMHINVRSQRGWPDHMYIKEGRCCFIEFKAVGLKPIGIQIHYLRVLNANGTPSMWTDNYDEAVKFLTENLGV